MSKKTFYKNNRRSTKDVPLDVIERWLKDSDWRVRQAAMNACQHKGRTSGRYRALVKGF